MPETVLDEAARTPEVAPQAGPAAAPDTAPEEGEPAEPTNWLFYGLGLSLQTLLWFLLFLAIVIAVAVGSELTEFRYVGF
jgi:hypothetical protein